LFTAGGPQGSVLLELLEREQLRAEPCRIHGWTRESISIADTATDQQYRFVFPGPELSDEEWQSCMDMVVHHTHSNALLVLSGSLPGGVPDTFYAEVAHRARERGARVVLDTSGDALRHAVDAGVYLVKPNLRELQSLAGGELGDEDAQVDAARELIAAGKTEAVVLSLGAAGVLAVSENWTERLRSPSVTVKSTVGAGDSMVAGIAYGLLNDWELRDTVMMGIAAGTAAAMTPASELCYADDARRLFERLRKE